MGDLGSQDAWRNLRLADVVSAIRGGISPVCLDRNATAGEKGVISLASVVTGVLRAEQNKAVDPTTEVKLGPALRHGMVLMSRSNTRALVGMTAYVDRDHPDLHLPDLIWAIDVRPEHDPEWLASYLQTSAARQQLQARAAGTSGSMKKLSRRSVVDMPIVAPTFPVQQGIAHVLANYRCANHQLCRTLTAKRRFKRGLMQELLTAKRRLKEFDGKPWVVHRLGDLFDERVESGRTDLPLLSITAERGVLPQGEVDRKDTSNADKSKYLRIAPGDIGYNTMRMWQGVSALSAYEGIISPAYTVCVPKPSVHPAFAAYLFKLPAVIDLFHRHSQGLVNDTLNLKYPHFARIEVSFPDPNEQQAVAEVLQAVDREIDMLERHRDALDRQRRGVAELLLTGKVRVPA